MLYVIVLLLIVGVGLLWTLQKQLKHISWQLDWIVTPIREKGVADVMAFADEHRAWIEFQAALRAQQAKTTGQAPTPPVP